jgi:hypothetical protein
VFGRFLDLGLTAHSLLAIACTVSALSKLPGNFKQVEHVNRLRKQEIRVAMLSQTEKPPLEGGFSNAGMGALPPD